MKTRLVASLASALFVLACGEKPVETPDAGIDTSCGIDCAAQEKYGLIVDRCFEYTNTMSAQEFPSIGAQVRAVRPLEGGLQVIPLDYMEGGLIKMTDNFAIVDGALVLARRNWPSTADSVTYKDASGSIIGVTWWGASTVMGENFSSSATADVVDGSSRTQEPTTYAITTAAPTNTEKTVPSGTYENAVKLIFAENPSHGTDGKRVFVEGTGFTLFSSTFDLAQTGGTEYRLQGIRDVGTAEGGTHECGTIP